MQEQDRRKGGRPPTWLYIVNFYGQLSNEYLKIWKQRYDRVIVDNAQSYFQMPVEGMDTLYTCRKYFGVADGAFLYSDTRLSKEIPLDESFERMHFCWDDMNAAQMNFIVNMY